MIKKRKIFEKILILGSSLEALRAAELLAEHGFQILIVEKQNHLHCKENIETEILLDYISNTDIYNHNYIEKIVVDAKNKEKIRLIKNTELIDLKGSVCDYEVYLRNNGSVTKEKFDGIIFAPVIVPKSKKQPVADNYLPFCRFTEALEVAPAPEGIKFGKVIPGNIIFYIDEESLSRLVFSQVMDCADFCKKTFKTEVTIVTPDVLTSAIWLEMKYRSLREEGIVFIKYESVPKILHKDEKKITIQLQDIENNGEILKTDMLVFSEKLVLSEYDRKLTKILSLSDYKNIHFFSCKTPRKGIFICGRGRDDILGFEAIGDANECFLSVCELFPDGSYQYEENAIDVNKTKCTLCLTCVRTCPHKAIEFDSRNFEERAVKIIEEACFRCGQCVSECPTKALSFIENEMG